MPKKRLCGCKPFSKSTWRQLRDDNRIKKTAGRCNGDAQWLPFSCQFQGAHKCCWCRVKQILKGIHFGNSFKCQLVLGLPLWQCTVSPLGPIVAAIASLPQRCTRPEGCHRWNGHGRPLGWSRIFLGIGFAFCSSALALAPVRNTANTNMRNDQRFSFDCPFPFTAAAHNAQAVSTLRQSHNKKTARPWRQNRLK